MESPKDYFLALSNVLRGNDWRQAIDMFCAEHQELFDFDAEEDEEFGHGHYALWEEFCSLAEGLLDGMLSQLGGSIGALEKQIDRRLRDAPRGPRDAVEQDVLSDLMSFESFETFAAMMQRRAREALAQDRLACQG